MGVEVGNCEESQEVSSCDEDNNNSVVTTATPFKGGKEVVPGILIY